jgi:uncharacterized protein (TIGR02265 family)
MGTDSSEGFEPAQFDRPVDDAERIRLCPASCETRGTYFQFVVDYVEGASGTAPPALFDGMTQRRWVPWSGYPLREFMRLAVNAARIASPDMPLGEGLRRIGWTAYPSFASTMAGRVVLYAFGEHIEAVLGTAPRAYAVSLPGAIVTSERLEARHWRIGMRQIYSFADTYQLGVIEGALLARGLTPMIAVRRHARPSDLDIDLRW